MSYAKLIDVIKRDLWTANDKTPGYPKPVYECD